MSKHSNNWFFLSVLILLGIAAIVLPSTSKASVKGELIAHAKAVEKSFDLPDNLLATICEIESNWTNGLIGSKGEIGVCQVLPATVEAYLEVPSAFKKGPVLGLGSSGKEVTKLQLELYQKTLYSGKIDGAFGPLTWNAVKQFQKVKGLRQDGVVGLKTWEALFGKGTYPSESLVDLLWNPKINIYFAGLYLKWIQDNVDDNPMVMAVAYNGGPSSWAIKYVTKLRKKGYSEYVVETEGQFECFSEEEVGIGRKELF